MILFVHAGVRKHGVLIFNVIHFLIGGLDLNLRRRGWCVCSILAICSLVVLARDLRRRPSRDGRLRLAKDVPQQLLGQVAIELLVMIT